MQLKTRQQSPLIQLLPDLMNSTELNLATSKSLVKANLLVTENFNLLHYYKTR